MLFIRSFIFKLYFFIGSVVLIICFLPTLFMPTIILQKGYCFWGKFVAWGLRYITGVDLIVRGIEYIPKGAGLIAAKHQSAMETALLFAMLQKPSFILKKELVYVIPFAYFLFKKMRFISIDRSKGKDALPDMIHQAKQIYDDGYQVCIFPEGTRTAINTPARYKKGICSLYKKLNAPCVPLALNSGVFWGRNSFYVYSGTAIFEFLPPIEAGKDEAIFFNELQMAIESKTAQLVLEGLNERRIRTKGF